MCESLIAQNQTATAKEIVNSYLAHAPESVGMLSYAGLLSEPDPSSCPEPRRREIREQAIRSIKDPLRRAIELGLNFIDTAPVYGLGRFPVTLYKEQWGRLLDMADDIRAFMKENDGKLKTKQ